MPEKHLMARSRKALDVSSQRKTLGGGFKSDRGFHLEAPGGAVPNSLSNRRQPALAGLEELVVHAEADDVVIHLDVAGREHIRRDGAAGQRREGAEADIEELPLNRP